MDASKQPLIGLYGAGGLARDVMPILERAPMHGGHCVHVVDQEYLASLTSAIAPVIGFDEFASLTGQYGSKFNVAIADSSVRQRLAEKCLGIGSKPIQIVSPRADVEWIGSDIGRGAIICAFCFVPPRAKIGQFVQMNIGSYISHDCVIGDFVTFAPYAKINGNCRIGDHAYIGTGAMLKQGVRIGDGAVIGMGAVVLHDVPAGETWVGNPARRLYANREEFHANLA